jgi:hypothetical protein
MGRVFDPRSGADMKYLRLTGRAKKLHNLKLHNLNTLANKILLTKLRNSALVEHITARKVQKFTEMLFLLILFCSVVASPL